MEVVLSFAVMVFAIIVLVLVYIFGTAIYYGMPAHRAWEYFWDRWHHDPKFTPDLVKSSLSSYLERTNDYWSIFGQMYISIVLISAITVLLLTKTISAEAGLPLLSAIVAFAVARTSDKSREKEAPPERRE